MKRDLLHEAKLILSIPDLFERYGFGQFKNPCTTPLRAGSNSSSFSAWQDASGAWLWKDLVTGDGGSAVDFIAAVENLTIPEAIKRTIELAGLGETHTLSAIRPVYSKPVARRIEDQKLVHNVERAAKRAEWIARLEIPTGKELEIISSSRNLDIEALKIAAERGNLRTLTAWNHRAYVITDSSFMNAKARRLDGMPWAGGVKSRNLPGADNTQPIGLPESRSFPSIALVEGETDFLAAFHCLHVLGGHERIAPVCVGGASCDLSDRCLPYFEGKRIRIFFDNDDPGIRAGKRWANTLRLWGCEVDGFSFKGYETKGGQAVKDLNDWCNLSIESYRANKSEIGQAFFF